MANPRKTLMLIGFLAAAGSALQSDEVTGWKMQDSSAIGAATGQAISAASFDASAWHDATVPGTVLQTFVDRNVPGFANPLYGQNMLAMPDLAAQQRRYWFRATFTAAFSPGQRVWLELGGINYHATVFVNGTLVGTMLGAFKEAKFDITDVAISGTNCIAVKIRGNYYPGTYHQKQSGTCGSNGGVMSRDGPTFIASQGWDWIPTIPDRDMGIWKPVFVRVTGPVVIRHPWIRTIDVSASTATIPLQVTLLNPTGAAVSGTVSADISGAAQFVTQAAAVGAKSSATVTFPSLTMNNPQLWWPNGYGDPYLYTCAIAFTPSGATAPSDTCSFRFGVRQWSFSTPGGSLVISCNGQRILVRGGNWGMDDAMKRWDLHRLEAQVRYHKEMNFNTIRDWVGMTDREPFYDLCDRYGIIVWSDFWEPHSGDQPVPVDDQATFIANMEDKIYRVRNHACVAVWCARNETAPTAAFLSALTAYHASLDGTRRVQPSSGSDAVHSGGPYTYTSPGNCYASIFGFHTEFGGPAVMSFESMTATMPEASILPLSNTNPYQSFHDFCQGFGYPMNYAAAMAALFGAPATPQQLSERAQLINYDNNRACFEALHAKRFNGATGLLLWMSNCVWPSVMWQTYDYFLEGTGAMYGSMNGSEPVHVMYYKSANVQVVNNTRQALASYVVSASSYNLDGTRVWTNSQPVNVAADAVAAAFAVTPGTSTPWFLDLKLRDGSGNLVSKNFYWLPNGGVNISGMLSMSPAAVTMATPSAVWTRSGRENTITLKAVNTGSVCAVACRLLLTRAASGTRILPVHYNDNYFSLAPGDTQAMAVTFDEADRGAENPRLCLTGVNVPATCFPVGGAISARRGAPGGPGEAKTVLSFDNRILRITNLPAGEPWRAVVLNVQGRTVAEAAGTAGGRGAGVSMIRLPPGVFIAAVSTAGKQFRTLISVSSAPAR